VSIVAGRIEPEQLENRAIRVAMPDLLIAIADVLIAVVLAWLAWDIGDAGVMDDARY
jgi:hypothetical protein